MLRLFHHYYSGRKLAFFTAESAAIAVAGLLGAFAVASAFAPPESRVELPLVWPALLLVSFALVCSFQFALYILDLYDLRVAVEDRRVGTRMLKAAGVAAVTLGGLSALLPVSLPTGAVLGGAAGAVAGTLLVRAGIRALIGAPSRVLIVGKGHRGRQVADAIQEESENAFLVIELVEPPHDGALEREPLDTAARRVRADYVVMALDEPRGARWVEPLLNCRISGMRVYDGAGFMERVLRRMPISQLRASELAFADELTVSSTRRFLKRVFDLAVSLVLVALASPLMALVALAIKLDSRGPVFYGQERVGLGGKEYKLWKFRSMRTDAEKNGAVWAKTNDDRVTRVGKFIRKTRMDEIPQVINVLAGDMSFVGPRPERKVFTDQLKEQLPFYGLREAVKPGITGWAQIRYPYGASVEDARNKLEFDLYYVKNGSLFLDLAIIFHTVRHVLLGRGAR